jgi:mono/diheme cytochrome c family protein
LKPVVVLIITSTILAFCPTGARAASAEAGKAVYNAKCKACHGAEGQGNPAIAKMMKVEMKPLGETSADVKQVIMEGHGKMKPVSGLTAAQVDDVVAFVHSLKK